MLEGIWKYELKLFSCFINAFLIYVYMYVYIYMCMCVYLLNILFKLLPHMPIYLRTYVLHSIPNTNECNFI